MYLAEAGTYRPEGVGGDPVHPQQQISPCTAERYLQGKQAACTDKSHTIKNELLNRHISIQQVTNQAVNQQKIIFQKNWSAHHIQVLLEYDDFLIFKFLIL